MTPFYHALELFKMVCARQNISAKIIQDEFNVSRSTSFRYLQDLQSVFSLEKTDGAYRLQADYKLNSKLKKYEQDFLDNIIEHHSKSLDVEVKHVSLFNPNIILGEIPTSDKATKNNYEKLCLLIKTSNKCVFLYKDNEKSYIVEPYKIIYDNKSLYLLAKHADILKTFKLDYIKNIKDTGEPFVIDEKIIEEYQLNAKNIWHDANREPDNVVLKIDPNSARYFKMQNILPAQSIIQEFEDGSVTLSFQSSSTMVFHSLLLGWFGTFKVIKPKKYVDFIDNLIEQYKKD